MFDDLSNNLSTNLNLIETHPIIIWFNDNYSRIEVDSNEQDILTYLSLKDIFLHFIKSDYYQTLNNKLKKKTTFNFLKYLINYNGLFDLDYIESSDKVQASSIDRIINKKRIRKCHLLKGWKLNNENLTTLVSSIPSSTIPSSSTILPSSTILHSSTILPFPNSSI